MAKDNIVDITKTGAAKYKQLQQANAVPYNSAEDISIALNSRFQRQSDPYRDMTQGVASPLLQQGSRWGDSMWDDKTANVEDFENLSDRRAENQWAIAKLGAGIAKGGITAATTLIDGTLGLITGIGTALGEGRFSGLWDNAVTNTMNSITKWSEDALPNYYSQEELDKPWYENIFTANFWGDKFIKNLGFTVGAFYSGGIFSKGLTGLLKLMSTSNKATTVTTQLVGSAISAVNEGSIEGLNAANEYKETMTPMIDEQYNTIKERAERLYSITGDKEAYNTTMMDAEDKRNKALAKLNEDAAKVGNTTLALNIPLLTAGNYIQFARLYSAGNMFDRRKTINTVFGGIGKNDAGKYTLKGNKITDSVKILGGGLAEGTEEMSQSLASQTTQNYYAKDFNNYYRSLNDLGGKKETLDWIKFFGETLSNSISDTSTGSTWEEFAIGALTGLVGMPKFRGIRNGQGKLQSPVVLEENVIQKFKRLSEERARNQTIADKLNERLTDPKIKNYYQGLSRHEKYDADMDDAAIRNDSFDFKNAEHAQLISDIELFYTAGKIDDLKTLASASLNISDENIDAIIEGAKKESGNSIYTDDKGNVLSKEEIIKKINKQREHVSSMLDEYLSTRKEIDELTGQSLGDGQLNELTWMQTQLNNWNKRSEKMGADIKSTLNNIISVLLTHREGALIKMKSYSTTMSKGYNKAVEDLNLYNSIIDKLKPLVTLSDKALANTVGSKDNKSNVNNLIALIKDINDPTIKQTEKANGIAAIKDLQRLTAASELYATKLAEYILNPETQQKDHIKVDKETTKIALSEERKQRVAQLNDTENFGEIKSLFEERKIDDEDINNSDNETAKQYKKAELFKKKALEIVATSDGDFKEILIDLINSKFDASSSYDDLANSALQVLNEPESVMLLDDISKETIYNEFKHLTEDAAKKVKEGDSQKPNIKPAILKGISKSIGNDSTERIDDSPQNINDIINDIIKEVKASNLLQENKDYAITLVKIIPNLINKVNEDREDAAKRLALQNAFTDLRDTFNHKSINPLIDVVAKALEITHRTFSTKEEILNEEEREYESTAVTGVLKTVVPQFDLDAKRDGVLIDFVGDDRNQGYSYVYSKLKEVDPKTGKNAFDYVNEGNVKESDEVEVRYEPATAKHSELLVLYHNNTLINYLNTDEKITGVKEIKEKAKKGEKATVIVSKVMGGQYGYDRTKMQNIGDLLGTDDAKIGVAASDKLVSNSKGVEVEKPFSYLKGNKGKVYILLPNSKGTLTPKQLYVKHFNKDEWDLTSHGDTPIGKTINDTIKEFVNNPTQESATKAFIKLSKVLYLGESFHLNVEDAYNSKYLTIGYLNEDGDRVNDKLLISKGANEAVIFISDDSTNNSTVAFNETPANIANFLLNTLYKANLPFNINAKRVEEEKGYANLLRDSDVLGTYLTGKRMRGTWLLFNEEKPNNNQRSNDSFGAKKMKEDEQEVGTKVTFDNKQYYVRAGKIYYNGSVVDVGNSTREILDRAYIISTYGDVLYGINMHAGVALIKDANGERAYDIQNHKYADVEQLKAKLENRKTKAEQIAVVVKKLNDDQKLVIRDTEGNPDTSENSTGESVYHIKEDDGNVHEYTRVHGIIGSNYIGSNSGKAATNRGQTVDTFAREYLNALKAGKSEEVQGPDTLSEKAFNILKKRLRDFYDSTRKKGFIINTDRIVVFNKLNDGRRVAGELDVFAYNPTTGNIVIFDFKTSKYGFTGAAYNKPNAYYSISNREQHARQLSAYAKLIEDKYGTSVSNLIIVPFTLTYGDGNAIDDIRAERYISLNKMSNVFETKTPTSNGKTKIQWYSQGQNKYYQTEGIPVEYKNQVYYIIDYNNAPALVAPNGLVVSVNMDLGNNIGNRTQLIQAFLNENKEGLEPVLAKTPLVNSPYGNSIIIAENKPAKAAYKPSLLNNIEDDNTKADNPADKTKEEKEKKLKEKPVQYSTNKLKPDNEKSWKELDAATQSTIMAYYGTEKEEAKELWNMASREEKDEALNCI